MSALVVARWTVLEARRRRLVLAGVLLSVAFVALFAVGSPLPHPGADLAQAAAQGAGPAGGLGGREELLAISTILVLLGLYGVQFLAALLGCSWARPRSRPRSTRGAARGARPALSRLEYLLGRFLALAGLLITYVVDERRPAAGRPGGAGYQPGDATRVVGLMVLEVLILAVSLLGSTVLPTLANGVVMLVLFGLAWLGGIIGFVGTIPPGTSSWPTSARR